MCQPVLVLAPLNTRHENFWVMCAMSECEMKLEVHVIMTRICTNNYAKHNKQLSDVFPRSNLYRIVL